MAKEIFAPSCVSCESLIFTMRLLRNVISDDNERGKGTFKYCERSIFIPVLFDTDKDGFFTHIFSLDNL